MSDAIICVCEAAADRLVNEYRMPTCKVHTVHNGVNLSKFAPNAEGRVRKRRSLGISDEEFVIGSLGRLSEEKGVEILIRAFDRWAMQGDVRRSGVVKLLIVGSGPEQDRLKELSSRLQASPNIVFTGATSSPEEWYPAFDVYALPSLTEALPLSLLEALACGCFPVAARVGGIPEVIQHGAPGCLVKPRCVESLTVELASAYQMVCSDRQALSQAARQVVTERFDLHRQLSSFATIVESIAS